MGGRVFIKSLGVESKRIQKSEYFKLAENLTAILDKFFTFTHVIQAYKTKESFGDIDIAVTKPKFGLSDPELIKDKSKYNTKVQLLFKDILPHQLRTSNFVQNSEIFSYLINGFQCDLIFCPPKDYDSSICYFDYDPAGNLAGKLAHRFGLKLGHDGLNYIQRDSTNTFECGEIQVSKNWADICKFLNLNYEQWLAGFDTQEQIFDWIINSTYFDYRIFSYENMNHIARTRDRKRQSYKKFLQYIEKYKNKVYEWPLYKTDHIPLIESHFPHVKLSERIEELKEKDLKRKAICNKFNGNLVREWTGLENKALGDCLRKYKEYITIPGYQTFDAHLELSTSEVLKEDFIQFYEKEYKMLVMKTNIV